MEPTDPLVFRPIANYAMSGRSNESRFDIPTPRGMNPVDTKIRAAGMTGVGPLPDGPLVVASYGKADTFVGNPIAVSQN